MLVVQMAPIIMYIPGVAGSESVCFFLHFDDKEIADSSQS
jgi:hypothetical protein